MELYDLIRDPQERINLAYNSHYAEIREEFSKRLQEWRGQQGDGETGPYQPPERKGVGDGTEVTITETTDYPFQETIEFTIQTPHQVQFPLELRIPAWAKTFSITINGEQWNQGSGGGKMVKIDRSWSVRRPGVTDPCLWTCARAAGPRCRQASSVGRWSMP
ncbi:MAG: glycoside hydrolase family 127 protein [Balneolaceae bacterium]|nr:glycoside hydrolase family 127 protein [Balneolaceae bacterium]